MSGGVRKVDDNGIMIYYKNIQGVEHFYEYDGNGDFLCMRVFSEWFDIDSIFLLVGNYCDIELDKLTTDDIKEITSGELEEIKYKRKEKEFLSREEVSIFELMDL